MTVEDAYIRSSQLIDQLVLNRNTLDELGKVEVLWEYPQAHRVLGFICKSGRFDQRKTAFNLDQLETIGSSGALVTSDPVETDVDRVKQIQSLVNSEVWTDTGNRVGKIIDHVFHLKTGSIRQYLITAGGLAGLAGKTYALYPSQILSWGSRRVLVSAAIVEGLEVYKPGLQDRVLKFGEGLRDELRDELLNDQSQANQSLQSLMGRAKNKVDRAKTKAQVLAEQAKERMRDLSEEFREEFREEPNRDRDQDRDPDFDFEEPWEEEILPPKQPLPPRPKLNLEPKPPKPTTTQPTTPPRDRDPWDDEWES
jgi:uncharacterized protein YrrD